MKQTETELTFTTAELIAAIEADIAAAYYAQKAAERIDTPLPRGLAELKALLEDDDGDYPAAWDYAAATFAFAVALLVFWLIRW